MQYLYADITINPFSEDASDCLSAFLGEVGFDTFEPTEEGVKAYILKENFDEVRFKGVIDNFFLPVSISYKIEELENKDYNERWEKEHFDPILEREFGIRLDPRMAFGSGSHETTYQLVSLLMSMGFRGQHVLDMGCGTGVLGIAMAKGGAEHVTAIDIDDMSVENAKLNFLLNISDWVVKPDVNVIKGDASDIEGKYNTIVANIFKSVLINDMAEYVAHLEENGTMILSGFYTSDVSDIIEAASNHGLTLLKQLSKNDWAVLVFRLS